MIFSKDEVEFLFDTSFEEYAYYFAQDLTRLEKINIDLNFLNKAWVDTKEKAHELMYDEVGQEYCFDKLALIDSLSNSLGSVRRDLLKLERMSKGEWRL